MKQRPPLAEVLRPQHLDDYLGQAHLVGKGSVLRQAIDSDNIPSMIFWGPPGTGKTTLAYIISKQLNRPFYSLSAINSGVKDVREVLGTAETDLTTPILFIDEIHRFNKSQQDSLLGAVEKGTIILIGATTENPSFEVISPLLSRAQVYILKHLELEDLTRLLDRAVEFLIQETGKPIEIREKEALLRYSGGDARRLLNALELCIYFQTESDEAIILTNDLVSRVIQKNMAMYDKSGEQHYDIISAFIKSLRGSDPNASVYWLARMIEAGEDPIFIARRMLILASEDIGNANPNALLLANACFDAVHKTGYPECRITLAQTAVYLACSQKSNASYMAIEKALEIVRATGDLPVPLHLRNAPTQLMKNIGYGKDYQYAHNFENNFIEDDFLPDSIRGYQFYFPQENLRENELKKFLQQRWKNRYKY